MLDIINFLATKEDSMVALLKKLVEMESPTYDKKLTDLIGATIAECFEELTGGKITKIVNDRYGNHYRGEWGDGENQILILAHFDTVWPEGTLNDMPFTIKDGKAFGPGAFDMKGGLIQGLYALNALTELKKNLSHRVVFLFTSDEEIGSPTSRELIEEEANKSDYVFVLEPAMSVEGAIKTARKGVGIFHLEVIGKPAHAGVDPEKGISAIEELAKQVIYFQGLNAYEKGTTVNVGKIEGGTTVNVVPAVATADIDLRVKTEEEFERIVPLIKNHHAETDGVEIHITGGVNRPPFERTKDVVQLFEKAKGLASHYLDINLLEMETGGGSDGNFTAQYAPTLDGLGAVGDGAHAVHEHLVISEMKRRSALLAMLLFEVSNE